MRTLLFLLAIFAVTAGIGTPAQAQNYPWCAHSAWPRSPAWAASATSIRNTFRPADSLRRAPAGRGDRPLTTSIKEFGAARGGPMQS
jgi:hypothetical protein